MVLISKSLKEFKDSLHIDNFDALAILQFLHHRVEDIQPSTQNSMVLKKNIDALHKFLPFVSKKKRLGIPRWFCGDFRDVLVLHCCDYEVTGYKRSNPVSNGLREYLNRCW